MECLFLPSSGCNFCQDLDILLDCISLQRQSSVFFKLDFLQYFLFLFRLFVLGCISVQFQAMCLSNFRLEVAVWKFLFCSELSEDVHYPVLEVSWPTCLFIFSKIWGATFYHQPETITEEESVHFILYPQKIMLK